MKENRVEKLLNGLKGVDENFFKQIANEFEALSPDMESDPGIETIKEIMGEVSAQKAYLRERVVEVKKKIQDLKLLIKAKRTSLEIEKSKIRQESLESYQKENKQYILDGKKLAEELIEGKKKLPNAIVIELLKNMRPEKPTQNVLDDVANLKTEKSQKEIFVIEKKVNEYEELLGMLETLADKYEDKKFTAYKHATIWEAELRSGTRFNN